MEFWQMLLLALIIFLITAFGIFVVFNAFAGTGQQAGQNIFSQFLDALFGFLG